MGGSASGRLLSLMPLYDFRCLDCGERFEEFDVFSLLHYDE